MIEKLRRKFIIISTSSVFIVLTIIAITINILTYMQVNEQADRVLYMLAENEGKFPKHTNDRKPNRYEMSPEAPFSTRFFTAAFNEQEDIITLDTGKIAAITTEQATTYATKINQKGKEAGYIDVYKYRVFQKDYGTLIVFLDCRKEMEIFKMFLVISILISVVSLLSVFALVVAFSKQAIKPLAESYEKQKRFITDASHELKTPLAIISTNTEVLELDYGESEWTKSIKNQIGRMSELTSSLVSLARMDEENANIQMIDFSLSDIVSETIETFLPVAKATGKEIKIDVKNNVSYCGDEHSIRQLVAILLDNAIKYSNNKSPIYVYLKKQGKKCILWVYNTADHLECGNLDVLFERFYRTDSSRNRGTGGYGIGLSIAKAIVAQHKGKISAESLDGKSLIITVQF